MTHITDVIGGTALLYDMIDQGYVSRRYHPEFDELAILNYTEKAAYEGVWNRVTLNTRGLIYNTVTREVLARPFKKFFNYGQTGAPDIDLDAEVYFIGDKYDGSLGIVYPLPDGKLAVATRGSFESEQAKHATALLNSDAMGMEVLLHRGDIRVGYTPLYEIIFPENRIVVDYGDRDELVLLGFVRIADGAYMAPGANFEHRTLRDVLEAPPRDNAEGFVVWFDQHTAVKIKYPAYVELHRIVTGLNRKSVWRALKEGEPTFKALQEQLPDELYNWSSEVAKEIREQYASHIRAIDITYQGTLEEEYNTRIAWDEPFDRGRFARRVQGTVPAEYRGFMFSLLDGKDISAKVWDMVEPVGGER